MDFDIVQLLHSSTIDIQGNPSIVHVGDYGSPTVTLHLGLVGALCCQEVVASVGFGGFLVFSV
jgi:hypothetical protein